MSNQQINRISHVATVAAPIVTSVRVPVSMASGAPSDWLTAEEGYYLGTTAGHRYFGAGEGFAPGDRLHALVADDSGLPEPVRPMTVRERFERLLYEMDEGCIAAVWSDGRCVLPRGEG